MFHLLTQNTITTACVLCTKFKNYCLNEKTMTTIDYPVYSLNRSMNEN